MPAVDADSINGLHSWYDGNGKKVKFPKNAGKKFLDNHSFLWDRKFLVDYLKTNHELYLFGCSGNVFEMIDLFDKVYFLKTSDKIIEERLSHPSRKNPMGKKEYQRKNAIKWAKALEKKAKGLKIEFIDASLSPKLFNYYIISSIFQKQHKIIT